MKYRLQGYVADFGPRVTNAFDLTAWREATTLAHFGVGLHVHSGSMTVDLHHLRPDGTVQTVDTLECNGPGQAYSKPFAVNDLRGLLLPVITRHSSGVDYDLFFGTNDLPPRAFLRVAYLCHAESANVAEAVTEAFGHYQRIYDASDESLLLLSDDTSRPASQVMSLATGDLASKNATHICCIGGEAANPEMFARSAAVLRFLLPGVRLGAPVYPMRWLGNRPRKVETLGLIDGAHHGAGLDAKDPKAFVSVPRMPDAAPAGWDCVAMADIQPLADDAPAPRAVVPLSLWVIDDGSAAGGRLPDPDPGPPDAQDLHRQLVAAHRKMDAMRDELHRLRQADTRKLDDRMHDMRLTDPRHVRGDLDRASHVALCVLRNRHKGARAVIVGNGPSLKSGDLDRIAGHVSFGSNKIYMAFDTTDWRPDYYSVEDSLVMQQNLDTIEGLGGVTKIFPDHMRHFGYAAPDAILVPLRPPRSFENPLCDPDFPEFSSDLRRGLGWGSTVIYSQIQMAVHMGVAEIVLVGLDHLYDLPDRRQGRFLVHSGERNHFHPDYRSEGELWHPPNLDVLEVSYRRARDVCDRLGVRIVNASRKTRLDVFETQDFDSLF
jgi:hypothetical protein